MDIKVGDVLQMKKPHPCGCRDWQVLRVGMDFRLRCLCGLARLTEEEWALLERLASEFVKKKPAPEGR